MPMMTSASHASSLTTNLAETTQSVSLSCAVKPGGFTEIADARQAMHQELAKIVGYLHSQGLTPATSSNFSARLPGPFSEFSISMSGLDKGSFSHEHFMRVDADALPISPPDAQPSAEVLLHRAVYRNHSQAHCVLHTHSVCGVVLSMLHEEKNGIKLQGFEMLKAFQGVTSHEEKLWLPIFSNSQDMVLLAEEVEVHFQHANETPAIQFAPGFLLAGHGLYAWGDTPAQAKRHIEAFEYLFTCTLALKSHGYTALS
jgi:methylthioribulose-1-phosphate dehydratase